MLPLYANELSMHYYADIVALVMVMVVVVYLSEPLNLENFQPWSLWELSWALSNCISHAEDVPPKTIFIYLPRAGPNIFFFFFPQHQQIKISLLFLLSVEHIKDVPRILFSHFQF